MGALTRWLLILAGSTGAGVMLALAWDLIRGFGDPWAERRLWRPVLLRTGARAGQPCQSCVPGKFGLHGDICAALRRELLDRADTSIRENTWARSPAGSMATVRRSQQRQVSSSAARPSRSAPVTTGSPSP